MSVPLLLLAGVVVVPLCLALVFNSWDAPDSGAYVRMAFASVAGSTLAIVTVIGLVIHSAVRRASVSTISVLGVVAFAVTLWQVQAIARAATLLLQRLGMPV